VHTTPHLDLSEEVFPERPDASLEPAGERSEVPESGDPIVDEEAAREAEVQQELAPETPGPGDSEGGPPAPPE
jgi:hypothetical protein